MTDALKRIRMALQALNPITLTIDDDSAEHVGHAGAQGGGHFSITIVSEAFRGKSPVQQHQLVYTALGELMITDIHAVRINAKAPKDDQ